MGIKIINPGPLSTIQDLGRIGYQSAGFSTSGALDRRAAILANLLIGNPKEEAVIEATLIGPMIEFTKENVIAITGGDFNPTLNGASVPLYEAITVRAGDTLMFGMPRRGCRSYIAFAGGLNIPKIMNSKSTNIKCEIGGYQGRALKAMDEIDFSAPKSILSNMDKRRLPKEIEALENREQIVNIRVVLGLQSDYFSKEMLETFFYEHYIVTNESDRMGCKLDGKPIESKTSVDIISDGVPFGGIQIPSNGKPIIMLSDRQTTGGYAKIGTVLSVDISKLVQCQVGTRIRFQEISLKEAQRLYKKEQKEYLKINKRMGNA